MTTTSTATMDTDNTGTVGDPGPNPQTEPTQAAESAVEPIEPVGQGQDTGETSPNREAAKYRRQLRDVEAERDGLRTQVEQLQRAEVERLAGQDGHLARPSAIWASGVKLADVLGDDGTVSRDKVLTAVGTAVDRLGLSTNRPPKPDPSQGPRGGDPAAQPWAAFLKSK